MGPMLAQAFSFHLPISSSDHGFLDGSNPLESHAETVILDHLCYFYFFFFNGDMA
jgi:hypothetical protein